MPQIFVDIALHNEFPKLEKKIKSITGWTNVDPRYGQGTFVNHN